MNQTPFDSNFSTHIIHKSKNSTRIRRMGADFFIHIRENSLNLRYPRSIQKTPTLWIYSNSLNTSETESNTSLASTEAVVPRLSAA